MVSSGYMNTMANKLQNCLLSAGGPKNVSLTHCTEEEENASLAKALGEGVTLQIMDGESPRFRGFAKVVVRESGIDGRPVERLPPRETRLWSMENGLMTRVPANTSSLLSARTLVLDSNGEVFSYAGAKASRVERAVAEELARRIVKREYVGFPANSLS